MTTTTNPKAPKRFFAGISGIKSGVANIIDAGKTFKTLGPSQVKDEIQIAKHELKTKGIAVGKGAAFFGVAAVFGLFLIIALVAAAILGLGTVMPYWASALVFALIFLIVLAICALVGLKKVKAQLPFKPESAIFGLLFDLGVLKEGTAMSAERLKKEQAERAEQKAKEAEEAAERARQEAEERKARGEEEPKPPTSKSSSSAPQNAASTWQPCATTCSPTPATFRTTPSRLWTLSRQCPPRLLQVQQLPAAAWQRTCASPRFCRHAGSPSQHWAHPLQPSCTS